MDNKQESSQIPPLKKIFDIKRLATTQEEILKEDEEYYKMIIHPNLTPAALHHRKIFNTKLPEFIRYNRLNSIHNPMLTPPLINNRKASVSVEPKKIIDDAKGVSKVEVEGNRAILEVVLKDDTKRKVTLVFCDEQNYNILRIGDEVHAREEESKITFLINGDYVYVGGGFHERCLGDFGRKVAESDNSIERIRGSIVKDKFNEMDDYWEKFKDDIFKNMNKVCVSSEENMGFYTNFVPLLLTVLGADCIHPRTLKKMKFEEYGEIKRASQRSIFCGAPDYTEEKLTDILEKYPHLWKPEVTQHLSKGELLLIEGMTVFTNYKFGILEKPWTANALYGVGPLYVEDYDDPEQIDKFMMDYEKLARNIITSSISEETSGPKRVLVQSMIGGRFQAQKKFENPDQHSNEKIKNLIELNQLYKKLASIEKKVEWDSKDRDKITIGSIRNTVKEELRRMSDEFAEKLRKERMITCYIMASLNSAYDEVYISITPGKYPIMGKEIVVNPCDGPYGPGSPFMN